MLGEDVNGDFRASELNVVELDRHFLERALVRRKRDPSLRRSVN
jgi:hypothetical protein